MALSRTALLAIKAEIANDPRGVGYAGKTDAQIAVLLNNPVVKQVQVQVQEQAPISRILTGIAFEPNIIDTADVTTAKVTT